MQQPGAQLAPYGDATTLQHDYLSLASLPRLADLAPTDGRWGDPPQNQEAPRVPELPPYNGWCRCETWETGLALASPDMVLVTMWNRMTAIDAASGAILWQDNNSDNGHYETFVIDGLVVDQWGKYAAEVSTGRRMKATGKIAHYPDKPLPKVDAGWVIAQHHRTDFNEDPPAPTELAFLAQSGLNLVGTCRIGRRMFATAEWKRPDGSNNFGVTYTYILFAFDLTAAGALIPGKLKLVYPADSANVVAQFYASADPLKDDALMRQLVGAGTPAFDALLERIKAAKPQHVLALIALCQAARPACTAQSPDPPWPTAQELLAALKRQPSAALAPPLAVWLDTGGDPLVAQDIACLLARCGGPVANDGLLRVYDARTHVTAHAPQATVLPAAPNVEGGTADDWAYLDGGTGARYVAFTDSALASWRDIYLAIDAEGDGKYEEVLYTGLGNAYYSQCFPSGWDRTCKKPKARSSWRRKAASSRSGTTSQESNGKLRTRDGGSYKYGTITNAKYISSTIDFAPLRVDSDRDGLPDKVDDAMLLDPHNADSDGDGLLDGADALPNLDQRQLRQAGARGTARGHRQFDPATD